jgi:mono/diheme cytochrome c family protein
MRFVFLATVPGVFLAAASAAPAELAFADRVYPVLEKANCRGCHTAQGVASATRLHFPEPEAGREEIEAFGRGLARLVDRQRPEESLLLSKPTNRVKHTGGRLIAPASPQEAALRDWVRQLLARPPAAEPEPPRSTRAAAAPMRRLTHSQYNRTVRDLLGDQTRPADQFPPEDFVYGFKNQAEAQSIPALLADSYSAAAEKLARNALRDPSRVLPCRPRHREDAACREQFLRQFGRRAFRRPLRAEELARYRALHASAPDFDEGVRRVVEAMLQSPAFLYRVEIDARRPGAYEIASRLAFFLWDTMPDEALLRAAEAGELASAAGVERHARRMLDDPRAREALDEFVAQWLRFDRVRNTVRERRLFPQFSPELAWAMTEETRRLIADAVWNERNFMSVLTADYSFLNNDLANLYGVPPPAADFGRTPLAADRDRAGLLGQALFLTLTSKPADTSPTARGLFVREQFLCQHVPDPPPGTNANLPPLRESKPQTNRERLGVHLANESCAGCHRLIDPIGFGFEKYDAIGARREKLKLVFPEDRSGKEPLTVELAFDTSGEVAGLENSRFASPRELGEVLAASRQCQECVVKQLFRYAYGRPETAADRETLEAAFERFRASGFRLKEALVALAMAQAGAAPDAIRRFTWARSAAKSSPR